MTEQYAQSSINPPGGSVEFTATVLVPNFRISPLYGLVVIDTTAANSIVVLPSAKDSGPNARISVFKTVAANTVTLNAAPGDTIVTGAAGSVIADIGGSLTLVADPSTDSWYVVESTV